MMTKTHNKNNKHNNRQREFGQPLAVFFLKQICFIFPNIWIANVILLTVTIPAGGDSVIVEVLLKSV